MAIEVKIPPMGESITGGILASWHVEDGAAVKRDQPLFELETDKITSEGVAEADGVIKIQVEAGAEVSVGDVVASIDPEAKPAAGGSDETPEEEDNKGKDQRQRSSAETAEESAAEERPKLEKTGAAAAISPAVRRLAEESGIDPDTIEGTGKDGRVTKGDILKVADANAPESEQTDTDASEAEGKTETAKEPGDKEPATAPKETEKSQAKPSEQSDSSNKEAQKSSAQPSKPATTRTTGGASDDGRTTRRKMTPLRAKIAERLVQAKNHTAMLTTFNEVDMTAVRELRARHQDDFTKTHGIKLGFMSFFVKATVIALKEVPAVNASIDGDFIVSNHFFDIGVAVSTDRGLMVPVLRDCDKCDLASIEHGIADHAANAREGKITMDDISGGVFTITNGGVFGSLLSTPILNPPQSAILGMHAIQERPIAVDGEVVIRPMMYLALSYDHRVIDGREAVTFLVKIKQAIEDPTRLVIGI